MLLTNKIGYVNATDLGNASKLSPLSISFIICFGKCECAVRPGKRKAISLFKDVERGFCSSVSARETQLGFPACLSHVSVMLRAAFRCATCRWGVTKCLLSLHPLGLTASP